MVHRMNRSWLVVAVGLLACNPFAPPDEIVRERLIGTISILHNVPVAIQLPDTVSRGISFPVSVRTYGDGCSAKGELEVSSSNLTAELIPYDTVVTYLPPDVGPCVAILRFHNHEGMLRFDTPGSARVVIKGIEEPSDTLIAVVRSVMVK